jgi:transglutaminase-like putative cysteine protease
MSLPLSLAIPLPDALDPHVRNPMNQGAAAGQTGGVHKAYAGFSDHLDLDTRMIPTDEVVLRVKADRSSYWRAMAFDEYDGRGWRMHEPDNVTALTEAVPPFRMALPSGQHGGARVVQTFYIERDGANLIFSAWAAREVYFPTALIWHDKYGGLRSPVTLQKDMYYSVVSEPPLINRAALALQRSRPVPDDIKPYLLLPRMSERVRRLGEKVAGGTTTPFATMQALEGYLSTEYRYQRDVPAAPSKSEWVDHFLFVQRAGFCEQFATSLAVMGRLRGVPTRLVTGYATGDYNPFTGYYDVRAGDAHAWVEAWIPNQGWVPFDATPGSMVTADEGEDDHEREIAKALWSYAAPLFAGKPWAVVLLLGALSALFFGVRRIRRWTPTPRRSTAAYRRIRRKLAKQGVPNLAVQTPRSWLAEASKVPAITPALPAITAFVEHYEALRFGAEVNDEENARKSLADLAQAIERDLAGRPRV